EGYLTVGLYEDGAPGELFITMAKEGSTIGGLMDSLGTAISVALQYGVPVESLVTKFTHQRFEPAGMTHNRDIPFAKSLVDYIFRWMGMQFIPGYRAANAPQRGRSAEPEADVEPTPARHKAHAVARTQNGGAAHESNGNGHGHGGDITDKPRRGRGDGGPGRPGDAKPAAGKGQSQSHSHSHSQPATGASAHESAAEGSTLTAAMQDMQQDAPACDVCGTITVRNGTCYKCLNCGNSMGCS
ncbi:MAG: vitamin B12-dependent ribonucleotide reductase, partial [Phycisphaeraceae bacterium]